MSWDRSVNHVAGPDKPDRHSAADFGSTDQGRRQSRRRPAGGAVLGPPSNLTPVAGLTRLRDAARAPQPHPVYRSWITSESWACRVSPRRSISTNGPACASPGSKARPNDVTVTAKVCDRPVQLSGMPPIPLACGCEIVTNASSTRHGRAQEAVTSMLTVWPSDPSVAMSATSTDTCGFGAASLGAVGTTDRNATAPATRPTDAASRRQWRMSPPLLASSVPFYASGSNLSRGRDFGRVPE